MITFLVAAGIVACIVTPLLWAKYGGATSLAALLIVSLALIPRRVVALGPLDPSHAGITTSSVLISTYTLAVLLGVFYLAGRKLFRIPLSFFVFMASTLILMIPAWGGGSAQIAGWVHIMTAMLAWGVGYGLSAQLDMNQKASTIWAQVIAFVLTAQMLVVGITMAGVDLPTIVTLTDNVGERALGTLGNAAVLSKMTFLVLIILLPLTSSTIRATRVWAGYGVALSLILTGLSVSRANMVAVAILVAVWALLVPGRVSVGVRLLMIALGGAAVYFFAGPFIERMDNDAVGTLRPMLLEAAYRQIDQTPWLGVGINSYVAHVGQFDTVTSRGFPVHNTVLLMVAEVGIPLAIIFFLPLVRLALQALNNFRVPGSAGAFAWAILGAVPGLLTIMFTGWGMLSSFSLVLWLFVSGVASAQIQRKASENDVVLLGAGARNRATALV